MACTFGCSQDWTWTDSYTDTASTGYRRTLIPAGYVSQGNESIGKPDVPKAEPDKEKKPFEDRVLMKGMDYIRGEIKKADSGV